jgi:hypothetical protein
MVATVVQFLAEGTALKTQKAEQLKAALGKADLAALVQATPTKRLGKQAGVL